ncbi:Hypothetical predicted protein [Octopus vulgaris]|uniref:Uncharacterized protein n=1 Tax=Octopus vulgaris TaxID=6645 RepID=A0AA36EXV3_OCTVU|nr:Hypothetical predicted protein [Octopus vulgaris]
MTGNTLINVSDQVNAQDVATNSYVNSNGSNGKVNMSGDTMTGCLDTGGNRVMNIPSNPTDTNDEKQKTCAELKRKPRRVYFIQRRVDREMTFYDALDLSKF